MKEAVATVAGERVAGRSTNGAAAASRPRVLGKFLFVGDEKLYVRGVTYGTFSPSPQSDDGYRPDAVERDFAAMAAQRHQRRPHLHGAAAWLLDAAQRHGLRVMVGLPWEQHVAFLDDRGRAEAIERRVREGVARLRRPPGGALLRDRQRDPRADRALARPAAIERFLERLYRAAKEEDPDGLVTYVNFPSTEYLELPFLDFVCFNVYLEGKDRFDAYLARLQNIADDRPLVLAEIGLDSRRNGEDAQAAVARLAGARDVRGRLRRRLRVRLDRRVAPRRPRHRGLGLRPDRCATARRSRRWPRSSDAFAEVPFPPDPAWPRDLGAWSAPTTAQRTLAREPGRGSPRSTTPTTR